jgi:hypothetical protein
MPTAAELTLARYYAKKIVKAELQAQGRRVQAVTMAEITLLARERMAQGLAMAHASGLCTKFTSRIGAEGPANQSHL